jgi:hypothetical protein
VFVEGTLARLRPRGFSHTTNTYELTPSIVRGWFGGVDYVTSLVISDFISTSRRLMTSCGIWGPVGKRDYLGRLSQESGGGVLLKAH